MLCLIQVLDANFDVFLSDALESKTVTKCDYYSSVPTLTPARHNADRSNPATMMID